MPAWLATVGGGRVRRITFCPLPLGLGAGAALALLLPMIFNF